MDKKSDTYLGENEELNYKVMDIITQKIEFLLSTQDHPLMELNYHVKLIDKFILNCDLKRINEYLSELKFISQTYELIIICIKDKLQNLIINNLSDSQSSTEEIQKLIINHIFNFEILYATFKYPALYETLFELMLPTITRILYQLSRWSINSPIKEKNIKFFLSLRSKIPKVFPNNAITLTAFHILQSSLDIDYIIEICEATSDLFAIFYELIPYLEYSEVIKGNYNKLIKYINCHVTPKEFALSWLSHNQLKINKTDISAIKEVFNSMEINSEYIESICHLLIRNQ